MARQRTSSAEEWVVVCEAEQMMGGDPRRTSEYDEDGVESFSAANARVSWREGPLLEGEATMLRMEGIGLQLMDGKVLPGTLLVTTYQLCFHTSYVTEKVITIPLGLIEKVDRVAVQAATGAYTLDVVCKDCRRLCFRVFPHFRNRQKEFDSLLSLCFVESMQGLFALRHGGGDYKIPQSMSFSLPANATTLAMAQWEWTWSPLIMTQEYARMGVPGGAWRLTTLNHGHAICHTYPAVLAVPRATSDVELRRASHFRAHKRFPVLSWKRAHREASIARCSQPRVGLKMSRNVDDENLVEAVFETNLPQKLYIMDCRPRTSALANVASGAGFEMAANYENCEITFHGIPNIHAVRESFDRLRSLVQLEDDSSWLSLLESTKWLEYIRGVGQAATHVVELVDRDRRSVLVHCSDGWDRTAQVVSLAELLLDPYYRTLAGFAALVEKEWVSFGHRFMQRCGHGSSNATDEHRSPIFLQWLDCIHQVVEQFPTRFEFDTRLLDFVAEHVYSCRFGNFLCNSERERIAQSFSAHTRSIWDWCCKEARNTFRNPFFDSDADSVLYPSFCIPQLRLPSRHLQWNALLHRPPRLRDARTGEMIEDQGETRRLRHIENLLRDRLEIHRDNDGGGSGGSDSSPHGNSKGHVLVGVGADHHDQTLLASTGTERWGDSTTSGMPSKVAAHMEAEAHDGQGQNDRSRENDSEDGRRDVG